MRRKSERNKANKGTPEKKVEKPTRRITRRRGKASPVNSPERENAEDNVSSTPYSEEDKDSRPKTEEEDKDSERLGKDVSSSELIKTVLGGAGGAGGGGGGGGGDEEDGGSVWKVARADASPGEIQKLKLCRQRNISEASSDSSISKKKSNKWPDSGDGGTEEADSADEPVASSQMSTSEQAEDPSSSQPGQDSSEEVSDYKENLPETTSANLSDDQTNIDQQADFKENLLQQETTSTSLAETPAYEDNQSSSPANLPITDQSSLPSYSGDNAVAEQPSGNLPTSQPSDDQENSSQATGFDSITITAIDSTDTTTTPITPVTTIEPQELVEANSSVNDESAANANDENTDEAMSTEQSAQVSQDSSAQEPVASYENDDKEEEVIKQDSSPPDTFANDETNSEIVVINNETTDIDFDESRKESGNDEEEEGEIRDEVEKEQSPDSNSTTNVEQSKDARDKESTSRETRSSRRKHSKYRESSPDTPESGEKKTSKAKRKESGLVKGDDEKKNEKKTRSSKLKEDSVSTNVDNDSLDNNTEKEDILEINEKSDDLNVTISTSKPTKVSLKRSFSNRLSTDAESKKEEGITKNNATSESNQNKENHADNEQPDQKCQTKRRRWGTTTTTTSTDVAPAFSISTDSLKALVPGAKPLPANEVKLTKDEDDEKEPRPRKSKSSGDSESKSDEVSKNDVAKKSDTKTDNHIASRRKIVLVKETPRPKSPSPPEAQATNILLIRNLVRPFTLNQIKELLARTGTIVENGFWMDRIKSKCFVEYANEDQAFETRQALHGVSWPLSNPKKLIVEYATKDDMELARESSKEQPAPKKADPLIASADLWQQDSWSRDDRPTAVNKITVIREWDLGKEDGQLAVKEKERERKEFEKKKRQRSRSPTLEAHLPAPARKFKKKEEEPPTAKLLDDLFRKTKATPCIYWLPLTNEQIAVKEEIRRQHMAEHARRLEEMRRVERGRSRGDVRRRRSPRK